MAGGIEDALPHVHGMHVHMQAKHVRTPSTAFVEKNAKFLDSRGLLWEESGDLD